MAKRPRPRNAGRRRSKPPSRLPVDAFLRRRRGMKLAALVLGVLIMAGLVALDRSNLLIYQGEDWTRYHEKAFRVVKIVDGDTIDIDARDGEHATTRLRLWGIDTPETAKPWADEPGEPWAAQATQATRELAMDERVVLELEPHDSRGNYGRLLVYVKLPDGSYLNERLIQRGLAEADDRFFHRRLERYRLLEDQARREGVGLWSGQPAGAGAE